MPTCAESYSSTIVIGLNPALQKRFILSDKTPLLVPGNVHRASDVQQGIGGKGQDVFVALSCLHSSPMNRNEDGDGGQTQTQTPRPSLTYLAQFVGIGSEGDATLDLLNNLVVSVDEKEEQQQRTLSPSLETLTIRCNAKLRTCTTIIAEDDATELVEPSGTITEDEVQLLKQKVDDLVMNENIDIPQALCIMGSMPPGCPQTLYGDLYDIVASASTTTPTTTSLLCIIDSVVGLEHLFHQMKNRREHVGELSKKGNDANENGATHSHMNIPKNMLKVNLAELKRLANVSSEASSSEASGASLRDVEMILEKFFTTTSSFGNNARDALDYIAITNGNNKAFFAIIHGDKIDVSILTVPNLTLFQSNSCTRTTNKIYPIGAGDAVTAGSLAAWNFSRGGGINDSKGSNNLLEQVGKALSTKLHISKANHDDSHALTSFAFGIACGSASCLQEENSVLNVDDAVNLFQKIKVTTSLT